MTESERDNAAYTLVLIRNKLPNHSINVSLSGCSVSLWFPNCEQSPNAVFEGRSVEEALSKCWDEIGPQLEGLEYIFDRTALADDSVAGKIFPGRIARSRKAARND